MRTAYTLTGEARGECYHQIVRAALTWTTHAEWVVRPDLPRESSLDDILNEAQPYLDSVDETSSWAGTELMNGSTVSLYRYRVSTDFVRILLKACESLYEWIQPSRPEDIAFRRPDGSLWLATIVHERDAYFELSATEREELLTRAPLLRGRLQSENLGSF